MNHARVGLAKNIKGVVGVIMNKERCKIQKSTLFVFILQSVWRLQHMLRPIQIKNLIKYEYAHQLLVRAFWANM